MAAFKVSATQVLVSCTAYSMQVPRYALLEVSGATVIVRDYMDGFGLDLGGVDITRISASKFLAVRKISTASGFERLALQVVNIADSALRIVNPMVTIKNSFGSGAPVIAGVCNLSPTKQLVVFHDTSSFVQARVLEIAA